jgi:hypothetical protein
MGLLSSGMEAGPRRLNDLRGRRLVPSAFQMIASSAMEGEAPSEPLDHAGSGGVSPARRPLLPWNSDQLSVAIDADDLAAFPSRQCLVHVQ